MPGKFEGEKPYAEHFYELWMIREGDEVCDDDGEILFIRFDVEAEDIQKFPELSGKASVMFIETDQGFWTEIFDGRGEK